MKYDIKIDEYGTKIYRINNLLHREDGPACEYSNGDKWWYKNGLLHREDGPAVEKANGTKYWCKNDKLHREDGPAVSYFNGNTSWYVNDNCFGYNDDFTNESWKFFIKTLIFS